MNNKKPVKLTPQLLRKIISEEAGKFGKMKPTAKAADDATEVDADELGTDKTLDKKIDYMKALKIEEARLVKRLGRVRESLGRVAKDLVIVKA